MSEALLERLEKKKMPKKNKPIEIILEKGQIQVDTTIVDKTDTGFDITNLITRIKQRELRAPDIGKILTPSSQQTSQREEKQATVTKKTTPEKQKRKLKLPGTKSKTKRSRKPKPREEEIVLDIPASLIEIDEVPIGERIEEKAPNVIIKANAYYLNNREIFINFINSTFMNYAEKIREQKEDVSCDAKKSKNFDLMIHQQIVRDYINIYTPYRGLLLYHGLGAGKTCSSIAIAEGIKDTKKIIVLTPASLQMNYLNELKYCGDPLYKLNQYWEKIDTTGNKHVEKALSEVLGISTQYIRDNNGAWLVNMKKPSNFESLPPEDKVSVNNQITEMIKKKYIFRNYNGLRENHLQSMIETSRHEQNSDNPFDNKVVIIDEAHNFVSMIVNKISKKKQSVSTKLYELLLNAENCRVILLTGTPIINYPNEIAILFNMLRGYIKTYYLPLDISQTTDKINQAKIMDIFKKERLVDYIEYKSSYKGQRNVLIVTRNPFGFVSRHSTKGVYKGVSSPKNKDGSPKMGTNDNKRFINRLIRTLENNNISVIKRGGRKQQSPIEIEKYKALPDTLDEFNSLFIDPVTGNMKNINLFKKRIIGLTSYFRSAQEALLPRYEEERDTHIVKIPMSHYQLGLYEEARVAERKEERNNAKKRKKQGADEGIYGTTSSTYRIFSRAFCNFVFPNEIDEETNELIKRPMPKEDQSLDDALLNKDKTKQKKQKKQKQQEDIALDEDFIDGGDVQDRLDNIDGKFNADDIDQLKKEEHKLTDRTYKQRVTTALKLLKTNANKYLTPEALKKYGPKFLKVLQALQNPDYPGLHLIYSQFRTLEGIGILSLILEQNGFARFKITKNISGIWEIVVNQEDLGKPTFALYTGTESAEEKEIIRKIYNGTWDSLPTPLVKQLKKISNDNNMGEIIKVFMITSSGSEGITLKNTRFVHIIEPYWHPVRIEQVIGRARRICSHKDLEDEYKTVEVFIYLMTFTEIQLKGDPNGKTDIEKRPHISNELEMKDVSKIDKKTPLTSDEALFEISRIKKRISKGILTAIKETAIDCAIHSKSNIKEGLVCYTFGSPPPTAFSYKPEYSSEEADVITKKWKKKITWKAYTINIGGTKYVLQRTHPHPKTDIEKLVGNIYDLDNFKLAKKHKTNPTQLGRTQINPKNPKKIQYIKVGDPRFVK